MGLPRVLDLGGGFRAWKEAGPPSPSVRRRRPRGRVFERSYSGKCVARRVLVCYVGSTAGGELVRFDRIWDLRSSDGHAVPAYLLVPDRPAGAIALVHSYGGAEEQMPGLAAHLAEAGFAACCPDLRGHGEHPAPLGPGLLHDLEAAVGYCRRYGRVAADLKTNLEVVERVRAWLERRWGPRDE